MKNCIMFDFFSFFLPLNTAYDEPHVICSYVGQKEFNPSHKTELKLKLQEQLKCLELEIAGMLSTPRKDQRKYFVKMSSLAVLFFFF